MANIPAEISGFSVPDKLRYFPKPVGLGGRRVLTRINPNGTDKAIHMKSQRQRRVFNIPSIPGAFLDAEQLRIVWDAVACYDATYTNVTTTTDGESVIFPDGQYGLIYGMKLKSAGTVLVHKTNYNRLHNFMKKANINKEYYDTLGATEGYYGSFLNNAFRYANQIMNFQEAATAAVAAQAAGAATVLQVVNDSNATTSLLTKINNELITRSGATTRYSIHPHILLFDLPKAIHLGDFPNGLQLEIEFETADVALSTQKYASYMTGVISDANRLNTGTDLTTRSYYLDNMAIEVEYVEMSDSFVALWNTIKATAGHAIHFQDWELIDNSYMSSEYTIDPNISNVKTAFAFYQGINQVNGDRGFSLDKYVDLNLSEFFFKYGKLTIPNERGTIYDSTLTVNYDVIAEGLKALGKYADIDGGSIINYKDPPTLYNTSVGAAITTSTSADALNGKDFFIGARFTPFVNDDAYTLDSGTLSLWTKQHTASTIGQFQQYIVVSRDKTLIFEPSGGVGVSL